MLFYAFFTACGTLAGFLAGTAVCIKTAVMPRDTEIAGLKLANRLLRQRLHDAEAWELLS